MDAAAAAAADAADVDDKDKEDDRFVITSAIVDGKYAVPPSDAPSSFD